MSPLTGLYAIAIFLGSFLLFLVEPMAAKRLLPLLGGSAAVWTTCLVFFQVALLLGYLCAHWLATRLRPRAQAIVYMVLLTACLAQAGFNLHPGLHASTAHPILSVFLFLTALIGLPFVVLSATNPLLQAWYASDFSKSPAASSNGAPMKSMAPPYRLFALSNFGSLLALVIYPWLVEPRLSLREQSLTWLVGFVAFVSACAGIAWLRLGVNREITKEMNAGQTTGEVESPRPAGSDRLLWLLLAAGGSTLLCATTNHLSQNIAAIPLLWIVPLTIYLLSFVVAFSRGAWLPGFLRIQIPFLNVSVARLFLLGLTAVSLGGIGYMLQDTTMDLPLKVTIPFYCATLFTTCLFCHAELHRLRPAPAHATSFYLMIAAGGALGSIFVGIVAPLVLSGNYELGYGLVFTAILMLAVTWSRGVGWRVVWTGVSLGMVAVVFLQMRNDQKDVITQVRNFYGTLRVIQDQDTESSGYTRTLTHGTIQHGTQIFTDELRTTPTSYYAHDSGVGLALDQCCGTRPRRVGVIGLGAGTLAAYGRKGDVFRFYDINPLVVPIARNVFTYLRESAASIEIVPGDARLSLAGEPRQHYDVLVIDAFSGDAIPVHLLTSQAVEMYRRHLQPGGIIAFHVSNKYLNLVPVVEQQAKKAGLYAVFISSAGNDDIGEDSADWVLVTGDKDFVSKTEVSSAAAEMPSMPGLRLWTDDYNSVLPLLIWKEEKKEDTKEEDQPE